MTTSDLPDGPSALEGAIGEQRPGDPRGWLTFTWLADELQHAEDSTQFADYEARSWRASVPRHRPATATERKLLDYLGYTLPADLVTRVRWLSDGVRRRTWPQLEDGKA